MVTEGVVDVLEPVEVDEGDRAERAAALGEVGDAPVEHPPVGQPGELVVLGEVGVGLGVLAQPRVVASESPARMTYRTTQPQGEVAGRGRRRPCAMSLRIGSYGR